MSNELYYIEQTCIQLVDLATVKHSYNIKRLSKEVTGQIR
jgi:hypothetical protein